MESQLALMIKQLQNFSGSSGERASMLKKLLCEVVNGTLSDLPKAVASKLQKNNQYDIVIEFLRYSIGECPQAFVVCEEAENSSQNKDGGENEEDKVTYEFSCWIISQMLRVLGDPACHPLHGDTAPVITYLLTTIRLKDNIAFKKLIVEFIRALGDLVIIMDKLSVSPNPDSVDQLQRFACDLSVTTSPKEGMGSIVIPVPTLEVCELLQCAISEIVYEVCLDVCQYADDCVSYPDQGDGSLLWTSVSCQLEYGDVPLKTISLKLLCRLLEYGGLPHAQPLDYFVDCLVALVELLCSGTDDIPGDFPSLEAALTECLDLLQYRLRQPCLVTGVKFTVCKTLFTRLVKSLTEHGTRQLYTDRFRSAVCDCISYAYSELQSMVVGAHQKKEFTMKLLEEFGSCKNTTYAMKYLRDCVMQELPPNVSLSTSSVLGVSSDGPSTETEGGDGDRRGKHPLTSTQKTRTPSGSSDEHFEVIVLLNGRLEQVLEQLSEHDGTDQDKYVELFEGVSCLVDTLLWCQGVCLHKDHPTESVMLSPSRDSRHSATSNPSTPQFVDNQTISDIIQVCKQFLVRCTENEDLRQIFLECYKRVISIIGSFLFVQDQMRFNSDVQQTFAWMLSLPWLPNDVSWNDLKPRDHKDAVTISAALAEFIDDETIAQCLHLLALLPKEVAAQWRTHVLKIAINDSNPVVRRGAVTCFPLALHHFGPNANHLVFDVLHSVCNDKCEEVLSTLASTVGSVACVVSRKALLHRVADSEKPSYKCIQVKCTSCQDIKELDKGPKDRPKFVDPTMFLPFLELFKQESIQVRIGLVKSLKYVFGHIGVRSNNAVTVKMLNTSLQCLEDQEYKIRMAFSAIIGKFVGDCNDGPSQTDQMIVTKLKTLAKLAKEEQDSQLLETILVTVGQLGKVAENDLLFVTVIILLESVCTPTCPLEGATAHIQLKKIGVHKQMKMRHLFVEFGKKICQMLVEHIHDAQKNHKGEILTIIQQVSDAFEFEDIKSFLRRSEHLILPHLVQKATPTASTLLRTIAKQLGDPNHKGPLARNIRHIYCHLVTSCQQQEIVKTFDFLERESEWDLSALLKYGENADSELMLHLGSNYEKVLKGLKMWASKLGYYHGPSDEITDEKMADMLQNKLLGILVHFDNHLNNGTTPLKEKKEAFESLISLMRLMGVGNITAVRMRVMTTLRIGLKLKDKDSEFAALCCRAWKCFVHSVDVASLGSMLTQILVNLLPLLPLQPQKVAEIFNYLIIENRNALHPHFHELYFIPDVPELADVNAVLKKYEGAYSKKDLKTQIENLLKGISHESMDVRQLALSKLKTLLHHRQGELHQLILNSETVDPIISQTVNALLSGCLDADSNTRSLYGECLGKLGAIDPGRLEVTSSDKCKGTTNRFHPTVTDDNFAFDLLNELAKAFLRAEDRNTQDCVAFAIQELIQICGVSNDPEVGSPGSRLWRRFPQDVQEILTPLMVSRYVLTMKYDWTNIQKPIYKSKKGRKFTQWICTLCGYLASLVTEERPHRMFESCRAVIKNDSQVALYLVPYVTVHVLLENQNNNTDMLIKEILSVLNHVKEPDTRQGSVSDLRHMSAQTVFSMLDHLTRWMRHRVMVLSVKAASSRSRTATEYNYKEDGHYRCIEDFLSHIPDDLVALASYNCSAFTRSLMHYEEFVKSKQSQAQAQEDLDFMQKLYVALDDPDGVAGITATKHTQPTLAEKILAFESTGQMSDASLCYGRAIQQDPDELSHRQGLLRCRLALGELNSAMEQVNGIITKRPEWSSSLNSYRIEAAWKLGQWDDLQTYLKPEEHTQNWNVGLGKLLLSAKDKCGEEFGKHIKGVRKELMGPLSAASMEIGSYQRGYEYIARLQMLDEAEVAVQTLLNMQPPGGVNESQTPETVIDLPTMLNFWEQRLQFTQCSFRNQEPILNLRRLLLCLGHEELNHNVEKEIGQCWLKTAKIARESGLIQTAHSSLLSASNYSLPEYCIEYAKWLWERGDYDMAQSTLEKGIEEFYPEPIRHKLRASDANSADKLKCAKMQLQLGLYCEETSCWESNAILRQYMEVMNIHNSWEDGYFYLAKYYDKLMTNMAEKKREFLKPVFQHFGNSLQFGNQYIYQSLPRMLSIWLDFGAEIAEKDRGKEGAIAHHYKVILKDMTTLMGQNRLRLAPYQLLTAFPQLISRICHTHPEVFRELMDLIAMLLVEFPQQCVWMMMAVSKSSYQMRVKRCLEIFHKSKSMKPDLNKFLSDATKLTDRLLDLCNKPVEGNSSTLSITQHFKPLQRLIDDSHFSQILLPLQSLMTVTLPSGQVSGQVSPTDHNPFPGKQVYIRGLEDTVEVLPSLQKPKKITMRGSDGRLYMMLCKPKDDLRKDARLMEFNGIVNKCLRKDPESRRRDLHIRTFTVTPLNEECGLLEWVSNTTGLRHLLMKLYKERGLYTSGRELKALQLPPNAPLDKKLDVYKNKLLPRHPSLFSQWFLKTFQDPTSWYNARLAYCRTSAVMSIVGYILGLGDRHGENILLDSTNGDVVHVDFNCLFNKGESFDYPEIVPFRLTHNMVEAMGPMGFEGVFRRACEVTLRNMRNQSDPLMSVLKTFIYDPLVEWSKPARGRSNPTETGEIRNEKAQTHVSNIEARLKGILKNRTKPKGLPLSVEGHVNILIKEATDENNLCQMFIGWAPYM